MSERAAACVRSIVTGVDDGPPVSDDAKSRYMWLALEHFCDLLCEAFTRNLDAGRSGERVTGQKQAQRMYAPIIGAAKVLGILRKMQNIFRALSRGKLAFKFLCHRGPISLGPVKPMLKDYQVRGRSNRMVCCEARHLRPRVMPRPDCLLSRARGFSRPISVRRPGSSRP